VVGNTNFPGLKKLEAKGDYQKSWELYQEFAAKNPRHTLAAEALFRAGWLAQKQLGDCVAARAFYDMVLQNYPQSGSWAAQSAYYRNNCPDYFPVIDGFRWVEGDSDTKGKNARIEIVCRVQTNKESKDAQGKDQLVKPFEKLHYKWSLDGAKCIVQGEITPEFKQWMVDNAAQVLYLGDYNPITGHAENSVYEFIKSHSSEWDSVVNFQNKVI
jgi:tetratricopeptide (TPR) repeat protein